MRFETQRLVHGYGLTSPDKPGGLLFADDGSLRNAWGPLADLRVVEAVPDGGGLRVTLADDFRVPVLGENEARSRPTTATTPNTSATTTSARTIGEPTTAQELLAERPVHVQAGTSGAGEDVDEAELEAVRAWLAEGAS